MGHQKPPAPVVTDSATRNELVNKNTWQCRSRAIDMIFYWFHNRVRQLHCLLYWKRGNDNLSNYFTKHHQTKHHSSISNTYLVPTPTAIKHSCYQVRRDLWGCVKYLPAPGTDDRWTRSPLNMNGRWIDGYGQANRHVWWICRYLSPMETML